MSNILKTFLSQRSSIRRTIGKYCSNPADIDELEQDVFLTCFALELKEEIGKPKHLLLRVAKNLSLNRAKRKVNTTSSPLPECDSSPVYRNEMQISVEDQLSSRQMLRAFAEALATLSAEDRRIFIMRRVEGVKSMQIATRLNISVRTVERRSAKAMLNCYRYLKANGYDVAPIDRKRNWPDKYWVKKRSIAETASMKDEL